MKKKSLHQGNTFLFNENLCFEQLSLMEEGTCWKSFCKCVICILLKEEMGVLVWGRCVCLGFFLLDSQSKC